MAADNCVGILAKMLGLFGSPFYSPSTLPPFLPLFIWGVSKRLEKLDSYELRRKGKKEKKRNLERFYLPPRSYSCRSTAIEDPGGLSGAGPRR